MRGKAGKLAFTPPTSGITPAYAGKRPRFCWAALYRQDHPRLCGEKSLIWRLPETSTGSPPPMRGKETTIHHNRSGFRITPAYAGKRPGRIVRQAQTRDHPRLCGEKACRENDVRFSCGSPPPMRGKVLGCGHAVHARGITPAYAGKSYRRILACPIHRDHPRLCGEKLSQPNRL